MPQAVTCAACGAKLREDRLRCLRCGATLTDAARRHTGVRWTAVALVGGVVLSGVFAMLVAGGAVGGSQIDAATSGGAAPDTTGAVFAADRAPSAAPRDRIEGRASDAVASLDAQRAAVAAYNRGDISGSLEELTAAVEANPQNAEALNSLGQVLVRGGRPREAIAYFDRAIALADGNWAYHFNRGRAYGELNEWTRAVAAYRDALRLFPDDYATHYNLAKALEASGQTVEALGAFEQAIALAPGQSDFHLSHGLALDRAGRPLDAAAAYRRFLDLEPDAPEAEKVQSRIAEIERQFRS